MITKETARKRTTRSGEHGLDRDLIHWPTRNHEESLRYGAKADEDCLGEAITGSRPPSNIFNPRPTRQRKNSERHDAEERILQDDERTQDFQSDDDSDFQDTYGSLVKGTCTMNRRAQKDTAKRQCTINSGESSAEEIEGTASTAGMDEDSDSDFQENVSETKKHRRAAPRIIMEEEATTIRARDTGAFVRWSTRQRKKPARYSEAQSLSDDPETSLALDPEAFALWSTRKRKETHDEIEAPPKIRGVNHSETNNARIPGYSLGVGFQNRRANMAMSSPISRTTNVSNRA